MGEVQTSCCGDPELGGEPMCPPSPAREAGRGCVLLDGADFESQPASKKIGMSASGSGEQPCSPLHDDNGASVEGQIESLVSGQALLGEALTTVADEEKYGFPGLSPLRTFGVGGGYEAVLFSDDRDESGLFVSSGSDADCLLMATRGNTAIQADELCCPPLLGESTAVPSGSEANRIKERVGDQLFGLQTVQGSPLDHVGKWQEQSESDACVASEGIGTCPLEIVEGEKQPSLQLETEAVWSVHSSPDKVVPSSAIEGSDSLHSSHVMTATNYSSKLSSGVGNGTSTCCKPSPVIVFRRSNPKRAASLRNTPADRNPDQLARTIHGAKKRPKAVDTKTLILSRISNSLTRKRRFSCRPALRSVWGAVENLILTFEQNDKLANCDRGAIRAQNKKTKKERSGLCKKRSKSQKGGNLRVSNARSTTQSKSAHITHIKDQKPQNSLLHDVVDSQASVYPGVNGCLLKFDGKICVGFAKKGAEVEHKSLEQTRHTRAKLLEHRMHRDKDLESTLTQDTSAENMPSEYPLISSQSGTESLVETVDEKCLIDPGTSPDSDVYHPAMDVPIASACTTPTNQVAGMDPSALATETISHYSPNVDFSTYSEAFVTHASVSPLDTQPLTNHKKGKKEKKGKKGKKNYIARGSLLSSSEHRFGEREFNSPENLSKARKASKYSIPEWEKLEGCNERNPICAKSFRKTTRKGPICNGFQVKSSLLGMSGFERCEDSMKLAFDLENHVSSEWDDVNAQPEEGTLGGSLLTDKAKGIKLSRDTKARLSKDRSSHPDSVRHRRRNGHGKRKENVRKSCSKGGSKEKSGANRACVESGGGLSLALGVSSKLALTGPTPLSSKINAGSKVVAVDIPSSVMLPICDKPASKEYCLGLEGQSLRPRAAWVLCDDCQKWRCIPAALADIIDETNCKWTCKDNKDKAFADCSIPQEKTNAEINAELEISDASGDEKSSRLQLNFKAIEPSKPAAIVAASQPASWTLIKSNIFLHRNRKSQTIDEIMVCHCKPPSDGSSGCGEECLNRMLNIECVRGTCPCGYLCSNQQFQKRKYSKFKWFRCGKKGFGLQLQENVSPGQFLIEYVGEVLDFAAYEARQRDYASRGQKHFYFMTLNGGEVIDACIKGNLGRFINHSCVPNCRTEKWMVNGEVCIGLFAIRDIKKGEEVTFDYNYERVFGAAAKKCVCGSAECRGYIGGDPLNTEAIVQGDSDDEYLEPVMVYGDGERGLDRHGTVSDSIDAKVTNHKEIPIQMGDDDETVSDAIDPMVVKREEISIRTEDLSSKYLTIPELEICPQREDTSSRPVSDDHVENLDPIQTEDTMDRPLSDTEVLDNSSHSSNSIQTEEIMCKPVSDVQPLEVSLGNLIAVNECISDSVLHNKKLILSNVDDKLDISKPYPHTKSSRLKGTIKKARSRAKSLASHKAKKVPTDTSSGHFEGVEEKLNELLDEDGGISKRKDATKGYLKLLFVTAAEGDNIRGFACQSTRDLSLILDALLKTKSRMVLMDIINKNGLQMLHNIMKQNRSNFNRIPIIRKLLKVLEFLALKGILTLEHINRSPPCSGMESFKESILILTRHQDMQVNQIARNFRDKWIPRTSRRVEPSFKCWHDQGTRETDAIVRISEAVSIPRSSCESDIARETSTLPCQQFYVTASLADYNPTSEGKTRKRKSRWDHPSDVSSDPQSLWSMKDQTVEAGSKLMKFTCSQLEQTSQQELVWQKSEMHKEETSSCDEIPSHNNSMQQNVDDEAPPGFESPQKSNHAQIPCRSLVIAGDVVMMDHPQKDDEAPPGFGSPQEDHHPQIPSKTSVVAGDVVMAHLQERYLPHLTVSYGMPAALMQQLGASEAGGGNQCHPRWAVAPGMPFHPFPPLPLYTRGEPNPTAPGPMSSGHSVMTERTKEETQLAKQGHIPPHLDLTDPRTSGERSAHMEAGARNLQIKERVRWPSHGCGRRFFRPQRWHNQRFDRCWPPWPREGNGFRGSPNHGASNNCIENTRRENSEAYYFPEGVSSSDVRSNFHQPPRHD